MHSLAQFIMAGRLKAALVAFFGNLVPFISPAAVGLVTLRRGVTDAGLLAMWAILPLLLLVRMSDVNPMMVWASIASMVAVVAVVVAALVLKHMVSWPAALLAAVGLSSAMALLLESLVATDLTAIRESVVAILQGMAKRQGQSLSLAPEQILSPGALAWAAAFTAIGALLLARWWQALLYNPGGFRKEFHALRLSPTLAFVLLGAIALSYVVVNNDLSWGNVLGLPLMLSGVALVHHMVAFAQLGGHWLVIFYTGLILLVGPLSLVLVALGFLDSLLDFRGRLAKKGAGGQ